MAGNSNEDNLPEVRDDAQTLEVLFKIAEAVSRTRNLRELYRAIHFSLGKILNVDNFYIALHHEDRDSITFPYHVDEKDDIPDEIFNFSESASLTGKVIQAQKPLILFEKDVREFSRKQKKDIIGTVSKIWLGAPLFIKDKVIGAVAIQSFKSATAYQKKDLELLNTVSHHIALAIERKESEKKLVKQQQLLESILESSPVGICLVENRVFQWVNEEMVQIFGYESKEALTGMGAAMVYESEKAYKEAGDIIQKGLALGGKADFDYTFKRRDGSLFKAHVIITSSHGDDPMSSVICTFADISQRDLAQKEKMEKEKLQGVLEMAGAICHEINQPLQAIIGYTSLFDLPEDITARELTQIKNQAARIGEITRRLSNITRYRTISYPGDTQIVDIWGSSN